MSILEIDKIDIVATRPDSAVVKLVIADHLTWDDFEKHASLLQAKINTYLEFIDSGQLERTVGQERKDLDVHIRVALQHPPNVPAKEFLEQVRIYLIESAIAFEVASPATAD